MLFEKCSLTPPYSLRKTYQGAWRATWGQWWSAACRKQWGVAGPWRFLPVSDCTDPPWGNQWIQHNLNRIQSMQDRKKKPADLCHQPEHLLSVNLTYLVLSSIQCSSCWVTFWFFHSVKLATTTPGLKLHVLALIPSFLIASFLKSRNPRYLFYWKKGGVII